MPNPDQSVHSAIDRILDDHHRTLFEGPLAKGEPNPPLAIARAVYDDAVIVARFVQELRLVERARLKLEQALR